jgi:hypothetical protein
MTPPMTPPALTSLLQTRFGEALSVISTEAWQVETPELRLLVLLSEDQSWLRMLVPIASLDEARPFLEGLMSANFDQTLMVRYAISQEVLWGVYQHSCATLAPADFNEAIDNLIQLKDRGLSSTFHSLLETQIRQIISASKQRGQSLEATLQMLDRFYEEGLMGGLDQSSGDRAATLSAWRYQLERLWPDV